MQKTNKSMGSIVMAIVFMQIIPIARSKPASIKSGKSAIAIVPIVISGTGTLCRFQDTKIVEGSVTEDRAIFHRAKSIVLQN